MCLYVICVVRPFLERKPPGPVTAINITALLTRTIWHFGLELSEHVRVHTNTSHVHTNTGRAPLQLGLSYTSPPCESLQRFAAEAADAAAQFNCLFWPFQHSAAEAKLLNSRPASIRRYPQIVPLKIVSRKSSSCLEKMRRKGCAQQ